MLNLSRYNRFDALIARNEGCLRKVCRLYGGDNSALREDLYQEIAIRLWHSFDSSFHGRCKESTWVYRVAINTAQNYLRSYIPKVETVPLSALVQEPATEPRNERLDALYEAIRQLEATDQAIILAHLDGDTHREIALALGMGESAVKMRFLRIKEKLRTLIEKG